MAYGHLQELQRHKEKPDESPFSTKKRAFEKTVTRPTTGGPQICADSIPHCSHSEVNLDNISLAAAGPSIEGDRVREAVSGPAAQVLAPVDEDLTEPPSPFVSSEYIFNFKFKC